MTDPGAQNELESLADAVAECFENMAFMEIQRNVDSGVNPSSGPAIWARVAVLTPFSGALTLCCSVAMATEVAENLFGPVCDEITEAMIRDVMGEVANTIVGKLMGGLVEEGVTFTLGVPECGSEFECSCDEAAGCSFFATDEHSFSVCFKRS
ncbi:MAG: chemotaxis protein CheX [Planctomycetota bacterium]|jgi:CheY-specific phosphatase CheX